MRSTGGPSIFTLPEKVIPERLQILLRLCLDVPVKRPMIQTFSKHFRAIQRKPSAYLMQVVKKLQKHAEALEQVVAERSRELQTEMLKADALLREMLPASIVRRLRNKQVIAPEMFNSATITFSDIPVFQKSVSAKSPLAIIAFLNMVYSHLDRLIEAFDVYKVETISDSYLIASGLPVQNGQEHARETCRLAAALVKATNRLPDISFTGKPVQLRIGINTGPVVAAVIGTRMPRYCLFGDTMNTASRMESTGEEGKINISMETKVLLDNSPDAFRIEAREPISIKGKGIMRTFWVAERA
ncbi:atrial natriuretic peptide receptor 1-like [Paramacrobiotus metropolitanus]|uniref:atrial natriuretic peptide receptor 1-like n=1 Tax=Paramacrobiotus metropolitanus TaxID=2943436 RepID=UPI002445948E|nr:atrial natriuretic peptide receptor 1-like [Paramacrobiotus metropolitanus]